MLGIGCDVPDVKGVVQHQPAKTTMESVGQRRASESGCLDQTGENSIVALGGLPSRISSDHEAKPETEDKSIESSPRLNDSDKPSVTESASHLNDSDIPSHFAPKLSDCNTPEQPASQLNELDKPPQPSSRLNESNKPPQSRSRSSESSEEPTAQKENLGDVFVLVCVFLTNLMWSIDITGIGVFYPYLIEHFEASTAAVAGTSSINGFAQAICSLFAGYPVKAYGCRLPGTIGSLLFTIGLSMCFFAPNLNFIYASYGIITGCGTGLYQLASSVILQQRFSRNRGLATGICWLGASVGLLIGSIITNYLIQAFGWRGSFLFLGAIQAHRVPLCLFFRTPDRLIVKSKTKSTTNKGNHHIIVRFLKDTFDFRLLRQAKLSLFAVAYPLQLFCFYGFVPHTVNRALSVGLNQDQAVTATVVISAVTTVSRFVVSFIVNIPSVNPSIVFGIGMYVAFGAVVVIYVLPEIYATMTSAALFGLHQGCTTAIVSVVVVYIMGVKALPRSLAILMFIGGFAKLAGPFCIGWIYDLTGDYNAAYSVIGCFGFVSGCLMVALAIVTRRGRISDSVPNTRRISKVSYTSV